MMSLHQEYGLILVIHSDKLVQEWLAGVLEQFGHTICLSDNVLDGLTSFAHERQQLIIVELGLMHDTPLVQFAHDTPEVPVITVSSEVSMDEVLEGLKNGAIDHFFQHRDVIVLAHTVQRALERGRLLKQNTMRNNTIWYCFKW